MGRRFKINLIFVGILLLIIAIVPFAKANFNNLKSGEQLVTISHKSSESPVGHSLVYTDNDLYEIVTEEEIKNSPMTKGPLTTAIEKFLGIYYNTFDTIKVNSRGVIIAELSQKLVFPTVLRKVLFILAILAYVLCILLTRYSFLKKKFQYKSSRKVLEVVKVKTICIFWTYLICKDENGKIYYSDGYLGVLNIGKYVECYFKGRKCFVDYWKSENYFKGDEVIKEEA